MTQGIDLFPLVLGVRKGGAGRFVDAFHRHLVLHRGFAFAGATGNGCGTARARRAGKRDVSFACEESGSGVETDPSRTRKIDFRPGVKIRKIDFGATGAVEAFLIGLELDEVAGNEAGGEPHATEDVYKHPCGIAAGSGAFFQSLLWRLHAGFHADFILHCLLRGRVKLDEDVNRAPGFFPKVIDAVGHPAARVLDFQKGVKFPCGFLVVGKRIVLSLFLKKEVEGVVNSHLDNEIHLHVEALHLFIKDDASKIVSLRVLLPIDEMVSGADLQRVCEHPCLRMGGRSETDDMRSVLHEPVILVTCAVVQGDVNGHCVI